MKKAICFCLSILLFSTFAIGQVDYEKCIKQFKAEADSLAEQFKQLDKEFDDLSRQRSNATTKAEQDALAEEGRALNEKREALRKQVDEAAKRQNRCMGIPTTKEEAQKAESDMKARIAKMEQDWKAAAKPYENMAAGPSRSGSSQDSGTSQDSGIMTQELISIPPVPEQASTPPTAAPTSVSPSVQAERLNRDLQRWLP